MKTSGKSIESFFTRVPRKDVALPAGADALVVVRCIGPSGSDPDQGVNQPGELPGAKAGDLGGSPARRSSSRRRSVSPKKAPDGNEPPPPQQPEGRVDKGEPQPKRTRRQQQQQQDGASPGATAVEGEAAAAAQQLPQAEASPGPSPRRAAGRKAPVAADAPGASAAVEPDSQPAQALLPLPAQHGQDGRAAGGQASAAAPTPSADSASLTPAQRAQIAANRHQALARLAVTAADKPGAAPLALASLLVEPSWKAAMEQELGKEYVRRLEEFLQTEWRRAAPGGGGKPIYPPRDAIFRALNTCPLEQVKVVILGQDPYHGQGQAMGLSFSVPRGCKPLPPSLLNIFKEAKEDLGWPALPQHGDLSGWAVQGVLLLNAVLTVREAEANSHQGRGWEQVTDAAISRLSTTRRGVVFLLWGKPAQAKKDLIAKANGHHVLMCAHPSPLSARRGFIGCRHFSTANKLLQAQGAQPVDWAAGLF